MTKVYEVKKSTIDSMGVCEYTVGMYATRSMAEEDAIRMQAVADEFRDAYSCNSYKIVEHDVIGAIDD